MDGTDGALGFKEWNFRVSAPPPRCPLQALEESVQTVGKLEGRVGQLDAELASTRQLAEKSREETEAVRKRLQMADEVRRGGGQDQ